MMGGPPVPILLFPSLGKGGNVLLTCLPPSAVPFVLLTLTLVRVDPCKSGGCLFFVLETAAPGSLLF
jgi:hypothetical protein